MIKSLVTSLSMLVALAPAAASAQQAPFPPTVRLIVPFAAGAATDVFARAVANRLGPRIGTTVIVENRAGAASLIGAAAVVNAPRDGSTFLFTSASLVTAAATARSISFDVTTDLVPVAFVLDSPLVVGMSAKSGIKTPAELVAAARAKPDSLTVGSSGVGGFAHMAAELLNDAGKIQIQHIPYKGSAPALLDVAAGTIDMTIAGYSSWVPLLKSGRVVPIGVTTAQPSPAFPGMPTMASAVPGYSVSIWYGVFAPAGTSDALVQRLNHEVIEISKTPELRELIQTEGGTPVALAPKELAQRVRDDYATWKRLAVLKRVVAE